MNRDSSGPRSVSSTPFFVRFGPRPLEMSGVGPPPVRERADAVRNRQRVLAAAERLFAERGVPGVTMDDIAAEAGVGKGTLYRRFTDKGGLGAALLDQRGRELQEQILDGPPPLGPGAPPVDRLVAFVSAYLAFQLRHLDLVLMSETSKPGGRLVKGSYVFWRQHLVMLLRQAGAPDPVVRAEVLLAGLSAEQVRHWLEAERRTPAELDEALTATGRALTRGDRPSGP